MNQAHRNQGAGPDGTGLWNSPALKRNLETPELYEEVIRRGEGQTAEGGALVVETGRHTGRSPKDKFVVRESGTEETVWWQNNGAMTREAFETLKADMLHHARGRGWAECAWQSLCVRGLLVRPTPSELGGFAPGMTIIDLPSFKADPAKY